MERQEIVTNTVAKLLEAFKNEDFPKEVAYSFIARSQEEKDALPCCSWSFCNRMIMLANDTDAAMGFRQWQKLNRFVKKGSHAFYIFVPLVRRGKDDEEDPDKDTSAKTKHVYGFRVVPVFRLEDTDGEELPFRKDYKPMDPPAYINVAEKLGLTIDYGPMIADYLGYFDPCNKKIQLCSQTPVVFFHELSHAMHRHLGLSQDKDREKKEIVAEFSAVVLANTVGVTGYESRAYDYIREYAGADESEQVLHKITGVLKDVEAVVTNILAMANEGGDIQ